MRSVRIRESTKEGEHRDTRKQQVQHRREAKVTAADPVHQRAQASIAVAFAGPRTWSSEQNMELRGS